MKKLISLLVSLAMIAPIDAGITSVGLDKTQYTSDFMIGKVVVSVIFPESNGSQDPNIENWSETRKTQVMSQIMSGLDWWTQQNPRSPLSFTFTSRTVATKYEPITRPYTGEDAWIPDVMGKIGYSGSKFNMVRQYNNDLRTQYKTDWAYTIFVVDSLVDSNGQFSDGLFAYAYLGGPYVVMTYDNNGYGINNMDVVVAHESGHIFNALDEYSGATTGPSSYSNGYFPTINGNHEQSSSANDSTSIMRGGIRWGLDKWAKLMIGWRDNDGNNRDDILDQTPKTTLSQTSSSSGASGFSGTATVSVLPRQSNNSGYGLTMDTVSKVEYRLKNGTWASASATDGTFDSATEAFSITIPAAEAGSQSISIQDVDVRVTTLYASQSGSGSTSAKPAANLSDAHVFPNPFKPNSNLGQTEMTFTGLTPGAKIQVFSTAGEPVFDKTLDAASTTYPWKAVNSDGEKLASGVYIYLITDSAGNKKKGKLAVIR